MSGFSVLCCLYVSFALGSTPAWGDDRPTPPSKLHTFKEGITAHAVSFTFEPSSSNLCTGHTITFTSAVPGVDSQQQMTMSRSGRFATVSGLFPGTEYDIEIVANGEQGDSPPLTGKVTTKAAIPSGPPEDLTTVEKSSTWFVVSWKDPHPARRGDVNAALSYDLRMNGNSVVEGFKGYSYNFTGLKPLRKHTVSVLTRNSIGVCKDQHAGVITVTTIPVSDQIKHSEL